MSASKRRIVVLEMNIVADLFPLVCGYLEAYAHKDPVLADAYEFVSVTSTNQDDVDEIVARLVEEDADYYALSCYVWNMGWMREVGRELQAQVPDAKIILGGPQVMHHAHRYLSEFGSDTIVCNGEGEVTFANILRAYLEPEPDFSGINGISFQKDGVVVTGDPEPRITDLDSIPSPFLTRPMDGSYRMVVFETNRGCPYSCGFCYWGAANNSKIHRFSDERIRAELAAISDHHIPMLFLADANWGILKRDVEFSRLIVEGHERTRYPLLVTFQAAKNKPERVAEISKMFVDGGMMTTHPLSMQSLDSKTLELVDRKNIKLENFSLIQESLNEEGVGSYIELIWPLPGETLESFKTGIGRLCARGGRNINVYTHMLLHNTPMYEQREEFGLTIVPTEADGDEADIVVATAEVSPEQYNEGLWYTTAVTAFHNTCSMFSLEQYLNDTGTVSYTDLLDTLAAGLESAQHLTMAKRVETTINEGHYYRLHTFADLYYSVMHEERVEVAHELRTIFSAQPWWRDTNAQVLFELDRLLAPVLYRDTDLSAAGADFKHIDVRSIAVADQVIEAVVPSEYASLVTEYLPRGAAVAEVRGDLAIRVDHRRGQLRLGRSQNEVEASAYRHTQISQVVQILPDVIGSNESTRPVVLRKARKLIDRSRDQLSRTRST